MHDSIIASCVNLTRTSRLIKWNLICFTSMHTAKDTRQVAKWSEQLGENILLHVTPKCLYFTTKTWKSCHPQICRQRFTLDTTVVTPSVKNSAAVKLVLYQTQKDYRRHVYHNYCQTSKGHMTSIISNVNSIPIYCGVAYESVLSLARGQCD